jgi:hypothetical protein
MLHYFRGPALVRARVDVWERLLFVLCCSGETRVRTLHFAPLPISQLPFR